MATVKKVGFIEDIIPTRQEIEAIHTFREALMNNRVPVFHAIFKERKLVKEKKVLNISPNPEGNIEINVRMHYLDFPDVKYIYHSKHLSAMIEGEVHGQGISYRIEKIFNVWGKDFDNPDEMVKKINRVLILSEDEPVKLTILGSKNDWIYKGFHYTTDGLYTDEEFKLLIFEEFDKERRKFERLKRKFASPDAVESSKSRPRIPERIRIQVWRRDGGKCVRCGSREN